MPKNSRGSPLRCWRLLAAVLTLWGLAAAVPVAQAIRVEPVMVSGRVLVSFQLSGAFTDEFWETIRSGLLTSLTYDVELRRAVTFGFDRTLATSRVTASVRYDNLTRRYQISRVQDGHADEERVTELEEEVRTLMTAFHGLPLSGTGPLDPRSEYYVRVRVQARPRNAWFVLPWDRAAASGVARLTFLP